MIRSAVRTTHVLTETDIWSYSLCELVQIGGSSFKNTPITEVEQACKPALFH